MPKQKAYFIGTVHSCLKQHQALKKRDLSGEVIYMLTHNFTARSCGILSSQRLLGQSLTGTGPFRHMFTLRRAGSIHLSLSATTSLFPNLPGPSADRRHAVRAAGRSRDTAAMAAGSDAAPHPGKPAPQQTSPAPHQPQLQMSLTHSSTSLLIHSL